MWVLPLFVLCGFPSLLFVLLAVSLVVCLFAVFCRFGGCGLFTCLVFVFVICLLRVVGVLFVFVWVGLLFILFC